ncbi:CNNM domain-containing protein [Thalassoglobus polymorphus]|uniref:CNNM transmembrane domain-containing protein n=1 Tax=Thalassoglobus polymorphus TaxID=2527994 RepID=A0A517QIT4_9PLAN|nr:CNNM domain-containing protein [Thalassoglobus polymorphus]QDT31570.1 hypothetical protein Mal48_08040 [Thalassoglobus polymorphus]
MQFLEVVAAIVLFLVGLRLSAFFSGSETGFYRLSLPRLNIDARAGDRRAQQLLWFTKNPAYFVATCLIGNNVANYLTTAAIGWVALLMLTTTNEQIDIAVTLLMSPIIFQFGELLPKSIYYLTPLTRLRKDIRWFQYFFRAFLVLSFPLVLLTRLLENLSMQKTQPAEIVLGRNRLVQLLQHGHDEGVLTDIQSRLTNGLLQLAPQSVRTSMTPLPRILGLPNSASKAEILEFARKFGISAVVVHHSESPEDWYGYVPVAELLQSDDPQSVIRSMPVIDHLSSKLVALHQLQRSQSIYGVVKKTDASGESRTLGILSRNGLVEQIYRPELTQSAFRAT